MRDANPVAMKAAEISIRNLNLSYGAVDVLKNINLDIRAGEFFAFLGPSGCGKTTLLRAIAGFNTPQSGSIVVNGRDILALPPWKRDVGMVFQSYALWPHMTIWKNVAFGLEERRLARQDIARRVDEALDLVGLRHLSGRRPSQLSGGQQQRVALARTIATQPSVLLLDEPLSNLDANLRVQVRREILAMQRRLGLTTIFVTHDQEEANTICDRIAVMKDGVVQQVGAPVDLYDNPANMFVAGFLGTANVIDGIVAEKGAAKVFETDGVQIALPREQKASGPTKLFFRPQQARLVALGEEPDPDAVRMAGTIRHKEFLGASMRYFIQTASGEVFVDVPHGDTTRRRSDEQVIGIDVPTTCISYLTA